LAAAASWRAVFISTRAMKRRQNQRVPKCFASKAAQR